LLFLVLFYFYPLLKIVLLSFVPEGSWNPGQLNRLISTPIYKHILWFTTWQAVLSTTLTLVLALPGAYVFSRYRFFGKNILQALMTVPFVLPTVVTAAATRFRPVILTAITTILGLLPMATGISFDFRKVALDIGNESSQWWGPMAVAVIFGLAVATLLTLVVVPVLCSLLNSLQERFGGSRA